MNICWLLTAFCRSVVVYGATLLWTADVGKFLCSTDFVAHHGIHKEYDQMLLNHDLNLLFHLAYCRCDNFLPHQVAQDVHIVDKLVMAFDTAFVVVALAKLGYELNSLQHENGYQLRLRRSWTQRSSQRSSVNKFLMKFNNQCSRKHLLNKKCSSISQ